MGCGKMRGQAYPSAHLTANTMGTLISVLLKYSTDRSNCKDILSL